MPGRTSAYAKKRYSDEVHRLLGVMNTRLSDPQVSGQHLFDRRYGLCQLEVRSASWPPEATTLHLSAWFERLMARPAVIRGLAAGKELRKPVMSDAEKQLPGQRAQDQPLRPLQPCSASASRASRARATSSNALALHGGGEVNARAVKILEFVHHS